MEYTLKNNFINIIKILLIIIILLFLLNKNILAYDKNNKYNKSIFKNIISDNQKILSQIEFGFKKTKFNVISIPKWKIDIMDSYGIPDDDKIIISVINNLECTNEFGKCLSKGGGNIGYFQINYIHKDLFNLSNLLLKKGDYKELYKVQLEWTYKNLKNSKNICKNLKNEKYFKCLLSNHNRNNKIIKGTNMTIKEFYGLKGYLIKKELENINLIQK